MMKPFILVLTVLCTTLNLFAKQKEILYAGCYSQRGSKGLYVYQYDRTSNNFALLQTMEEITNPNFLVLHPSGHCLYSVNTVKGEDGKNRDVITSFSVDHEKGTLIKINQMPTYGSGACHISMDHKGKWLFVSHYNSGNLAILSVNKDGSVGDTVQFITDKGSSINNMRQKGPHVHSTSVSPDNKFVYLADLGIDKIMIYKLTQQSGKISPAKIPFAATEPGAGPRHFTFHPSKPFFYLAQELNSTVTSFIRDEKTGSLTPFQTLSTLPDGFGGRSLVADIHTDPTGKFLYVSNRGHNSLAIFSISDVGKLTLIGHEPVQGDHPRNFMVDSNGEFVLVANMNTDNVVQFMIDTTTGKLSLSGVTLAIPAAVCLKWFIL